MTIKLMNNFFSKYLDNTCSESEFLAFINLFLKPENENELNRNMKEHWKVSPAKTDIPDLDSILYKIHYEINKREQSGSREGRFLTYLTRIAAILFIPLAIATFFYSRNDKTEITFQSISTPLAAKANFTLPDGSTVYLNAGSTLSFPSRFEGDKRLVKLEGEAYFDVVKSKYPFEVETSELTVDVYGTAFNVMNYDNELPEVTLERGKVAVTSTNGEQKFLNPGEQAQIDTSDQHISINVVETDLFTSWINNKLIFKDEPLEDIIKRLERWYNISIEIDDEMLAQKRINATLEYESISEVMDLLEITLPLKFEYKKNERKLVIKNNEP
ncbi:MAG: FecR family protein [Draconibacterium sp.]